MTTLFENSHDALVFAFNFSSQQYGVSELARIAGSVAGSGKGLVGLDGAGQAGMIMREVDAIGRDSQVYRACIVARFSPKFKECPCCHQDGMPLQEYREAITVLRDCPELVPTGLSLSHLREIIIRTHYERGVSFRKEIERLNVTKTTAYDHRSVVIEKLKRVDAAAQGEICGRLDKMCGFQ